MSDRNKEVRVETTTSEGLSKTITVREIENGFIIKKSVYGYIGEEGKDGKYIDKCKEFFTKENPIAESQAKAEENELNGLLSSLSNI